jgi:hypothetical protein
MDHRQSPRWRYSPRKFGACRHARIKRRSGLRSSLDRIHRGSFCGNSECKIPPSAAAASRPHKPTIRAVFSHPARQAFRAQRSAGPSNSAKRRRSAPSEAQAFQTQRSAGVPRPAKRRPFKLSEALAFRAQRSAGLSNSAKRWRSAPSEALALQTQRSAGVPRPAKRWPFKLSEALAFRAQRSAGPSNSAKRWRSAPSEAPAFQTQRSAGVPRPAKRRPFKLSEALAFRAQRSAGLSNSAKRWPSAPSEAQAPAKRAPRSGFPAHTHLPAFQGIESRIFELGKGGGLGKFATTVTRPPPPFEQAVHVGSTADGARCSSERDSAIERYRG